MQYNSHVFYSNLFCYSRMIVVTYYTDVTNRYWTTSSNWKNTVLGYKGNKKH